LIGNFIFTFAYLAICQVDKQIDQLMKTWYTWWNQKKWYFSAGKLFV